MRPKHIRQTAADISVLGRAQNEVNTISPANSTSPAIGNLLNEAGLSSVTSYVMMNSFVFAFGVRPGHSSIV